MANGYIAKCDMSDERALQQMVNHSTIGQKDTKMADTDKISTKFHQISVVKLQAQISRSEP